MRLLVDISAAFYYVRITICASGHGACTYPWAGKGRMRADHQEAEASRQLQLCTSDSGGLRDGVAGRVNKKTGDESAAF